jgi:exodeoxyribonuclease V
MRTADLDHDLDRDQSQAISAACAWFRDPTARRRPFLLNGPAGSGKTHTARQLADRLAPARTAFIAPTGRAAQVLTESLRKAEDGARYEARTIHSQIYEPPTGRARLVADLRDRRALCLKVGRYAEARRLLSEIKALAALTPMRRNLSAFDGKHPALLVVDEASMVNAQIAADIASFGIPTIALGDEHQLPPVTGRAGYPGPASATLTTIRRYGDCPALVDLATAARSRQPLPTWNGVAGRFSGPYRAAHLTRFDQVVCGRNATRWALVRALREVEGRKPGVPEPGDRIMALRNDLENGVVNGLQGTVREAAQIQPDVTRIATEHGTWMCDPRGFTDQHGQDAVERDYGSDLIAATFARAITCHKAQGGQWPSVAVINESSVFRREAHRWLYTAVTRAQAECIVLSSPPVDLAS